MSFGLYASGTKKAVKAEIHKQYEKIKESLVGVELEMLEHVKKIVDHTIEISKQNGVEVNAGASNYSGQPTVNIQVTSKIMHIDQSETPEAPKS